MVFKSLKQRMPQKSKERIARKFDVMLQWVEYLAKRYVTRPFEKLIGRYFVLRTLPMYASEYRIASDAAKKNYGDYAIVITGKLVLRDRFTMETLLLYKRNFPGAAIIVSTWDDEDPATIQKAREAGVEMVLSKPLQNGGTGNINRQIVSARAGIERARALGKTYLLKTRCDQRMYHRRLLSFLANLLIQFPPAPGSARGRIIGLSWYEGRKKPYNFSDHFFFGYLSDIAIYYSLPLTTEPEFKLPFSDIAKSFNNEGYLLTHYAEKIGYSLHYTEESYYSLLGRHFIIVDTLLLDSYWYQYEKFRTPWKQRYGHKRDMVMDFAFWLELYNKEQGKSTEL